MASNYDDVLSQLQAYGLQVDSLEIGRMRRCKVEGDREKRDWYHLHELRLQNGDDVIVGSFGVWRGAENNATKVELRKTELSLEQAAALRKRISEDKKRSEAARKADAARAADKAAAWRKCSEQGSSDYLEHKGVLAHGVRFSPEGALVIPMLDVAGRIHGLQLIHAKGSKRKLGKEFWPAGIIKKHHFHLIGMVGVVTPIILVAEGYATGASLYEATGLPVAVAFDAGKLGPLFTQLHARYKNARILVCTADDAFSDGNPGVTCASAAALEVGAPTWPRVLLTTTSCGTNSAAVAAAVTRRGG